MKIGVIGSSEEEIMPLVEKISDKKTSNKAKLEFFQGTYKDLNVVALFSGVCKVNAAIATQVAHHDVADDILTEYHPWMKSIYFEAYKKLLEIAKNVHSKQKFKNKVVFGKIVTGENFISTEGRSEIISKYNPYCVDMETASVAHVCYANDIPFLAVRTISDTEEECGIDNFEKIMKVHQ